MHFGPADLAASLRARTVNIGGLNPDYPGDQWHYHLSAMVTACRAYGLRPIDGPFGDISDPDGFLAAGKRVAALGFEGKWAIHPSQVAGANEVFTPSEKEADKARRMLVALEEAAAAGKGAAVLDGKMIDAASARMAENVVRLDDEIKSKASLARSCGLMDIHEHQAKDLLAGFGVPVPIGMVAYTADQAVQLAEEIGGDTWAVKAQIHSGARGKAGGIKICKSLDEVQAAAHELLGNLLVTTQTGPAGKVCHRVLIEKAVPIAREIYLGLVLDRGLERVTIIGSAEGGMDIEQVAAHQPGGHRQRGHRAGGRHPVLPGP